MFVGQVGKSGLAHVPQQRDAARQRVGFVLPLVAGGQFSGVCRLYVAGVVGLGIAVGIRLKPGPGLGVQVVEAAEGLFVKPFRAGSIRHEGQSKRRLP